MPVDPNNPGTPPPAGAPAAQGGNAGQGGNSNPEGGAPQQRRLIAGKYETMEDAVEHGILGLETAFHKTREDIARVARVLEQVVGGNGQGRPPADPRGGYAPVGTAGQGAYGYGGDPYGRGAPSPDDIDPTQFLVNPGQILKQREARMLQQVAGVVENVVSNAMLVSEFKRQNPDLVPHERIVRAFMNETDNTKGYSERLADASARTRQYLTELRAANGGNTNPPPAGGNFVEGPRGGAPSFQPAIPGSGAMPGQVTEEEKELMDYINERNTDISARFGIKVK